MYTETDMVRFYWYESLVAIFLVADAVRVPLHIQMADGIV